MAQNFNYNGNKGGGGYQGWKQERNPVLPKGYLEGGYYKDIDGEKVLKKEYIIEYPKAIAKGLEDNRKNKNSQIRKYYEYCLRIRDIMKSKNNNFDLVEPELLRLEVFVKRACVREKVTDYFFEFISKNLNAIKNQVDFQAFIKHFEALIAYMKKD